MKNIRIIVLSITTAIILTGCGSALGNNRSGAVMSNGLAMDKSAIEGAYFSSDMDYGNANISGDKSDYSYVFSAAGDTCRTKEDMLRDYSSIQEMVEEKGGYIENLYSNYNTYNTEDISYNEDAVKYYAKGTLQFTVEIKNDEVEDVVARLEKICNMSGLTVTGYTQRIQNYKEWKVTDKEAEDDTCRYETISKDELDRRLAYADISVNMSYNIPRPAYEVMKYEVAAWFISLWDNISGIIKAFVGIAIGLFILFAQSIVCYKIFVRMIAKHKKKKPEYYPPKEVIIKNANSGI